MSEKPYTASEIIAELKRLQIIYNQDLPVQKLTSIGDKPTIIRAWPVILETEDGKPFISI